MLTRWTLTRKPRPAGILPERRAAARLKVMTTSRPSRETEGDGPKETGRRAYLLFGQELDLQQSHLLLRDSMRENHMVKCMS